MLYDILILSFIIRPYACMSNSPYAGLTNIDNHSRQ